MTSPSSRLLASSVFRSYRTLSSALLLALSAGELCGAVYNWDTGATTVVAGSNTWGTSNSDKTFSENGAANTKVAWPNTGGPHDALIGVNGTLGSTGLITITVANAINVNNVTFGGIDGVANPNSSFLVTAQSLNLTGTLGNVSGSVGNGVARTATVSSQLIGTGSVSNTGTGTLIITNAANNFSGGSSVSNGILQVNASTNAGVTAGPLGTGTLTLAGGTIQTDGTPRTLGNAVSVTNNFNVGGTNSTLTLGQAASPANGINLGGATRSITVQNASQTLDLVGAVSNGGMTKLGAGTLILSGSNTFAGAVTVTAGTMTLQSPATAIAGDGVAGNTDILINGGILNINGSNQIGDTAGIVINSGTLSFTGSNRTETIGTLTNNGGIFTTGTGTGNTLIGSGETVTWAAGTNTITSGNTVRDKHWVITGGTNTVNGGGTLEVQTGGGTVGLFFNGTASPTVTLDSSAGTAGRIVLEQNVIVDTGLTSGTAQILNGGALANPGFIDMNGGTRTFTINNGSAAQDMLISARIQNGAIVKDGAGTLALTGDNTFAGTTTVNAGTLEAGGAGALGATSSVSVSGGTLLLSGTGNRVNDAAAVTLSGGTILLSGNVTETMGTLTLGSGTSILDFSTASGIVSFAASNAQTWTGTLQVWNWSGTIATGGGTDRLFFGTNTSGLTAGQISNITFYTGAGTGQINLPLQLLSNGELVPVPEPSALLGGLALLSPIAWRSRRRWMRCREAVLDVR